MSSVKRAAAVSDSRRRSQNNGCTQCRDVALEPKMATEVDPQLYVVGIKGGQLTKKTSAQLGLTLMTTEGQLHPKFVANGSQK